MTVATEDIALADSVDFRWMMDGYLTEWMNLRPLIVFDVASAKRANELARMILRAQPRATEVRWNWHGSLMGHYVNRKQLEED